MARETFHDIERILSIRYEVGALAADPTAILWAAADAIEDLSANLGEHLAIFEIKKQLTALNRRRREVGKIPAYAPYGSVLF